MIEVSTIGFAETSAEQFFSLLRESGAKRLLDVRLNNTSQLAGFTKKNDLRFFVRELCGMEYVHVPELAPTQDMLDSFKKRGGGWQSYERAFTALMAARRIERSLSSETVQSGCLLCSEKRPEYCHRRLVAEYLQKQWGDMTIRHLV